MLHTQSAQGKLLWIYYFQRKHNALQHENYHEIWSENENTRKQLISVLTDSAQCNIVRNFGAAGNLILFNACHSPVSFLTQYFSIWYCVYWTHYTISLGSFTALLGKGQQEWFWLQEWMPWQFRPAAGLCHWPVMESQWGCFYSLLFLLKFSFILHLSPSFVYLFSEMLNFLPCSSAACWFLHPSILNMSKRWDVK